MSVRSVCLVLAFGLFAACAEDEEVHGDECRVDADCPAGQECVISHDHEGDDHDHGGDCEDVDTGAG